MACQVNAIHLGRTAIGARAFLKIGDHAAIPFTHVSGNLRKIPDADDENRLSFLSYQANRIYAHIAQIKRTL